MSPRVSVVVTCFNYAQYLRACVVSALAQSYRDFEVVIVDDGSTDDTPAVTRALDGDPRVRCVRQDNRGQAAAKNRGIAESRGELIGFLDADDLWQPDKLDRQIVRFSDPTVAVVYSRAAYIDADGRPLDGIRRGRHLAPRAGRVTAELFIDNFVPFSSSVVRRAALRQAAGFDETLRMGIDWDLWLRLSVDHAFDFVDAPLVRYRLGHPTQMSRNTELRQACADRIMRTFLERHRALLAPSTIRRAWAHTYVNRALHARPLDLARSTRLFLAAIRTRPLEREAYSGLIKNLLLRSAGRAPQPHRNERGD